MTLRVLSFLGLFWILTGSVSADFFKADKDPASHLPKDKIYPHGQLFPISGFQPKNLAATQKDGFTMAGPAYGGRIPVLANESLQLNMPQIYPIGVPHLSKDKLSAETKPVDIKKIQETITEAVREADKKYPNIVWWYLTPEELRYWRPNEFAYLQSACEAIRQADPRKRPVWMYNPCHYDQSALEKYVPYMDIQGKGMYTNYAGNRTTRSWVRWSSENQVKALGENQPHKFTISVPEMFEEQDVAKVPSWVRHDVYLSLICGSKGIVIFSLAERPTMSKAAHQTYYEAYRNVIRELKTLGPIFLFGETRHDLAGNVVKGPAAQTIRLAGRQKKPTEMPTISFMEKRHHSGRYLFAANSAEEPVQYRFSKLPAARITDAVTGKMIAESSDGTLTMSFAPHEVKLLRLEPLKK